MYDRYKPRRKRGGLPRVFFILILAGAAIWGFYSFRHYLFFWRYTRSRLEADLDKALSYKEKSRRDESLKELQESFRVYRSDNPVEAEAFYVTGRLAYERAMAVMPESFSRMVIFRSEKRMTPILSGMLEDVNRFIQKGIALDEGKGLNLKRRFILARSWYLSEYRDTARIAVFLDEGISEKTELTPEDVRFLAYIKVRTGQENDAVALLKQKGNVMDSVEGSLYLAEIMMAGKLYTDALGIYESLVARSDDVSIQTLSHERRGEIFYRQSLYQEALEAYARALEIKPEEDRIRLMMARSCVALGDREQAAQLLEKVNKASLPSSEIEDLMEFL